MTLIGYTPKQAAKIAAAIELDMVKIEDAAVKMRKRVTDASVLTRSLDIRLEEIREMSYELQSLVDRRTRTN